jgi:hypothetical protein
MDRRRMWRSGGTHFDTLVVLAITVFVSVSFLGNRVGIVFASLDFHSEGKRRINGERWIKREDFQVP